MKLGLGLRLTQDVDIKLRSGLRLGLMDSKLLLTDEHLQTINFGLSKRSDNVQVCCKLESSSS